jgi:antagonist of KipI
MGIVVYRAGLLTSIQDSGRWGTQALGVPVAGPMDSWSHRLANLLAGNNPAAAALEITAVGPELVFEEPRTVAIAGAEFEGFLDGARWTTPAVLDARAGSRLVFGARSRGFRAYLAVAGGFDVPTVLGSRATDLRSGFGGMQGRALRDGDRLIAGEGGASRRRPAAAPPPPKLPGNPSSLRVMPGPDEGDGEVFAALTRALFAVAPQSDRMGYRLHGERIPAVAAPYVSGPVVAGAIQVPPSGDLLLLMAERQTTGGYPVAGVVITADLPLAGQLAPGDRVSFEPCGLEEAISALIAREQALLALEAA